MEVEIESEDSRMTQHHEARRALIEQYERDPVITEHAKAPCEAWKELPAASDSEEFLIAIGEENRRKFLAMYKLMCDLDNDYEKLLVELRKEYQ